MSHPGFRWSLAALLAVLCVCLSPARAQVDSRTPVQHAGHNIPKLIQLAQQDPDPTVRAPAVARLADFMKDTRVMPVLILALDDPSDLVAVTAAQMLRSVPRAKASQALLAAAEQGRLPVRLAAMTAMAERQDRRILPLLLPLATDPDAITRLQAVCAMSAFTRLKPPEVIAALTTALRDTDWMVRLAALEALVALNAPADAVYSMRADPEPSIRSTALQALYKLKDARTLDAATAALRDADAQVRAVALPILRVLQPDGMTDINLALLHDPDPSLRARAARAFHWTPDARALPSLLALARDADPVVRRETVGALGRYPYPLVKAALLRALADEDLTVCAAAFPAIARQRDHDAFAALLALVLRASDDDQNWRQYRCISQASELLGKIATPDDVERIAGSAPHSNPRIEDLLADTLVTMNHPRATEALYQFATAVSSDDDPFTLVNMLIMRGDPRVVTLLLSLLDDTDQGRHALSVLTGVVRPATRALFALLDDPNPNIQQWATIALTQQYPPEYAYDEDEYWYNNLDEQLNAIALAAAAANGSPRQRWVGARVLARIGDARAQTALEPFLHDTDLAVRQEAALLLGEQGDVRAVEPLITLLGDPNVRGRAATALGKLGDPRAIDPLLAIVQEAPGRGRTAAINALAEIPDPRAIDGLINALDVPEPMRGAVGPQPAIMVALFSTGDARATTALIERVKAMLKPEYLPILIRRGHDGASQSRELPERDYLYAFDNAFQDNPRVHGAIATESFLPALRNPRPEVRAWAAFMLLNYSADAQTLSPTYRTLLQHPDAVIRCMAIEQITLCRDAQVAPTLLQCMNDADPEVRQAVLSALARTNERRAADALFAAWKAGDASMLERLAGMGDIRVLDALLEQIAQQQDTDKRAALFITLQKLTGMHGWRENDPESARLQDALATLRNNGDEATRRTVEAILRECYFPLATDILLSKLNDPNETVSEYALYDLERINDARIVDPILRWLQARDAAIDIADRRDNSMQMQCLDGARCALEKNTDPRAQDALRLLKELFPEDMSWETSFTTPAAVQYAAWDTEALVRAFCFDAVNDDITPVLLARLQADAQLSQRMTAVLLGLLQSGDVDPVRTMSLLASIGGKQVADSLLPYLHDPNPTMRQAAATAFGALHDPRALEELLTLVHDTHYRMQYAAINALATYDDPRVTPALQALLTVEETSVYHSNRVAIIYALGRTNDPAAIDTLVGLFASYRDQRSAIPALGQTKNTRAIDALITVLDRFTGRTRTMVIDALESATGQHFGGNVSQWRAWREGKGE